MSDPVSPSPRMFDRKPLPADDDVLPPTKPAVQGILKKVKGQVPAKPQANMKKPRAVPVEVIPDDEGEPRNVLPSDARSLLEPVTVAPRPSAPPHAFTQIFDYDERTGASSAQAPSQGSKAQASGDAIDGKGGMNGKDSKDGKAKHVRWTPNVMGNASPAAEAPSLQLSDPGVRQGAGKQPQGRPAMRARASMPGTGAEKQGAERAQAGKEKSGEDLQWYAVEAIENLKQQRSKPPSAV
ncbi:hypothetical protein BD626DRAFT_150323 [Schizophyllum amplum]|uniref:Uncharacterized protein n=1 Tax=Schizophyllum amplum TaxID=97359 RepID=A0A550C420_9AGAR|nr:hypothetical protein BD626DRAFT_150323 [Auriculariopsis ampla]